MKSKGSSPLGYYTIGIAALFLAGFLLLVILGAHSFRNTAGVQNENLQTRAVLSYLATCVKANDSEHAVALRQGPDGQILEIADGDTGYALRIFQHEGSLLEEYAAIGREPSPDAAAVIGQTEIFAVTQTGDLLTIETDAGSVLLHLRCEGSVQP